MKYTMSLEFVRNFDFEKTVKAKIFVIAVRNDYNPYFEANLTLLGMSDISF